MSHQKGLFAIYGKRSKSVFSIKAPSAYAFFVKENFSYYQQKSDQKRMYEIGPLLGKRWRNLNEKERKKYIIMANNAKIEKDKEIMCLAYNGLVALNKRNKLKYHSTMQRSEFFTKWPLFTRKFIGRLLKEA